MSQRALTEHDDRAHEHGGEHGWTETVSLVFADPAIVGAVRWAWDPGERTIHADLLLRLEDGTVVRVHDRKLGAGPRETATESMTFDTETPMKSWKLKVDAPGLAASTQVDRKVPPGGKRIQVSGELELRAVATADGFASRRQTITEQRFASIVSSGSFAQPVTGTGEFKVGDRRLKLDVCGVRGRSWGVREADPADAKLHAAFDSDHALWFEKAFL
jgi:hypothetical protein